MPDTFGGFLWWGYNTGEWGRADTSTWTCAKHLTLSHVTSLSLNWRDMDMMDGLQQVSHKTEGIQIDTKKKRSNKHWQAKINVHLEHQYSIRINARF